MNDANIYQISFDIALTDYNNTNPPGQPSPDDKLIVFASTDGLLFILKYIPTLIVQTSR